MKIQEPRAKNRTVRLRQMFAVENSALHYIRVAGNYNWSTSAQDASYTSVVDTAYHV